MSILWRTLELRSSDHFGICYFFITHQELASRITAVLRCGKQDCQFAKQGRSTIRHKRERAWRPGVELFHTDQYVKTRVNQVDNFTS